MVINKRVIRNLKYNKAFFIGSTILCMIIVAFIIACTTTGKTMVTAVENFYEECNVEDAAFYTEKEISDEDIRKLEEKYDVEIESMQYVNIDYTDSTVRVFCETEKVNLAQIKEGTKVDDGSSILLNDVYCENHNIELGQSVEVFGKSYTVTGFFTRPDYAYMLKSLSDLYIDHEAFGIGLLPEQEFDYLTGIQKYYSVVYKKENTVEFRKDINNQYGLLSYTDRTTNTRIKYALEEGDGVAGMASSFAPILFILNMGFIAVALSRIVKKDRQNMGVLVSFGYTKKDLCKYYVKYGLLVALLGSILGIVLGFLFVNPFLNLYCAEFNFPLYTKQIAWGSFLVGVILPFVLFGLTSIFIVLKMTKENAIALLHGEKSDGKSKNYKFLSGSKVKNATKYGARSALRNKARTIVFTFGIFIASAVILMGFVMNSSCVELKDKYLKGSVTYEYAYYLNSLQTDFPYDKMAVQQLYRSSYETADTHKAFLLIGMDYAEEDSFLPMEDENGKKLVNGNAYISKALSMLLGKEAGDKVSFIDPVTLEEFEVTLAGIIDNRSQKAIYLDLGHANELLGNEIGSYNAIYSDVDLSIDENIISVKQKGTEVLSSFDAFIAPVNAIVYVLIALGIILGVIVITIITGMTVDENARNISMLKVLGYKTKEISKMVFSINNVFIIIGYLLSIPIITKLVDIALLGNIETMSIYMEAHITVMDLILGIVVVYATYLFALLMAKKKVLKISMVESLKDNRE